MSNYLRYIFLMILLILAGCYFLAPPSLHQHDLEEESTDQKLIPSDYFFAQRAIRWSNKCGW